MFRPAHISTHDVTQSGTSITTERAVNAPIALAVLGNTTQVVEPPSANLLDQSLFYAYNNGRYATVTHNADGTVTLSGSYLMVANVSLPTGTYNFNCAKNCTAGTPTYKWLLHYTDGTSASQTGLGVAITATKPVDLIYVYLTTSASVTATVTFSEMMLNSGSTVLPYRPYGYLGKPTPDTSSDLVDLSGVTITVNGAQVARSEVLRGIGTARDVLDVTGGVLTRKIGKKVFDGTGVQQYPSSLGQAYPCFYAAVLTGRGAGTSVLCTHSAVSVDASAKDAIIGGTKLGAWVNSSPGFCAYLYLTIPYETLGTTASSTAAENVSAFQAWCAGRQLAVVWQLENETVEPVPATAINSTQGSMTIVATSNGTAVDLEATIKIMGNG